MTQKSHWHLDLRKLLPGKSESTSYNKAVGRDYPYIVEDGDNKSLYFDARNVQSRMRKNAPDDLQLGYTRTMMGFLLLQPQPRDILIVGLGGGSLSKFCHRQLPTAVVTTVEINAQVIAMRDEFAIPADGPQFRVIRADAADYMIGKTAIADAILLDGFEDYGLPEALGSAAFYGHCYMALRDGGVLVANLWDKDATQRRCRETIGARFDKNIVTSATPTSKNVIAFAMKNPRLPDWPSLQQRAYQLQRDTGLDFPHILDEMRCSRHLANGPARWLTGR